MDCKERCFIIKTPAGNLKVCAKHEVDTPKDFPGVYIDLVREGEDIPLACIEFDSCNDTLQSCIYGDGLDDSPTTIVVHRNI